MTQPRETSGESSAGPIEEWLEFERRPLLKALVAGATLSAGGGTAAATGEDHGKGEDTNRGEDKGKETRSGEIDPEFGYPTMDAAELPDDIEPDHEVELLAAPPDPEAGRPPLLVFDPVGLHVECGDVVQFTFLSPDHSVTAAHPDIGPSRRIPEEATPFSSPVMGAGAAWLYQFEHEGVYDLYCAPHQLLGMVMRLVVGDLSEEDVPEYAQTVEGLPNREQLSQILNQFSDQNEDCEWPFLSIAEVLGTDALAPMNIQEEGKVPFSAVAEELGYEFEPPEMPPDSGEDNGDEIADGNTTEGNATAGNETGR